MHPTPINEIIQYTKSLKVLFIEDDFESRIQTQKMLENFFDTVVTAVDGEDGFEKFKKTQFDIIFCDINMPKLNGIDLISKIREMNRTIFIVMISAYDDRPYLLKSIEIGVDGYLIKPVEKDQFLSVVQKIINKIYAVSQDTKAMISLAGDYYWNKSTQKLSNKTEEINLTLNEVKFLDFLISAKGTIRTYIEIDLALFQDEHYNERKIRNLVSRLRKKIGNEFLESLYAQGYRVKIVS